MNTIKNAIIRSADIRIDRDIFLSVWLNLDYGGAGQHFGGYILGGLPDVKAGKHHEMPNLAADFIVQCMLMAGVEDFKNIVGKSIRVAIHENGDIAAIGHILKDEWYAPSLAIADLLQKHKDLVEATSQE